MAACMKRGEPWQFQAMQQQLWICSKGWFAEYKDPLGLKTGTSLPQVYGQCTAIGWWYLADRFQLYQSRNMYRTSHRASLSGLAVSPDNSPYTLYQPPTGSLTHGRWIMWHWQKNYIHRLLSGREVTVQRFTGYGVAHCWKVCTWVPVRGGSELNCLWRCGELYQTFGWSGGMAALAMKGFAYNRMHWNNRLPITLVFRQLPLRAQLHIPDLKFTKRTGNTVQYNIVQAFARFLAAVTGKVGSVIKIQQHYSGMVNLLYGTAMML